MSDCSLGWQPQVAEITFSEPATQATAITQMAVTRLRGLDPQSPIIPGVSRCCAPPQATCFSPAWRAKIFMRLTAQRDFGYASALTRNVPVRIQRRRGTHQPKRNNVVTVGGSKVMTKGGARENKTIVPRTAPQDAPDVRCGGAFSSVVVTIGIGQFFLIENRRCPGIRVAR